MFLCADILGKSGDLAGVTTDDIDLLILAKLQLLWTECAAR